MKRILESCFVLFLFLNLSFAADVEVKLTTNDGTTKFAVQDSGAIDVAGIDSDGNMILEGTATIKGAKGLKTTYGITAGTITLNSGAANVATIDSNGNMILEGTATIKGAKGLKTTYGITAGTITLTAKKLLSGNTVAIQLDTDNNETVSFQILSSDGNEKARIDEDGKIFPGSSFGVSNVRYIYDDTTNYATRFSTRVIAADLCNRYISYQSNAQWDSDWTAWREIIPNQTITPVVESIILVNFTHDVRHNTAGGTVDIEIRVDGTGIAWSTVQVDGAERSHTQAVNYATTKSAGNVTVSMYMRGTAGWHRSFNRNLSVIAIPK